MSASDPLSSLLQELEELDPDERTRFDALIAQWRSTDELVCPWCGEAGVDDFPALVAHTAACTVGGDHA